MSEKSEGETLTQKQILPWMNAKTFEIQNPNLRLHKEIMDFYNYIKPSKETHELKSSAFERVKQILEDLFPGCKVRAFGSFQTKLYLPKADVDLVIHYSEYSDKKIIKKIKKKLEQLED